MLRTFRYRLYPNQTQRERIRKTIDACRFVYNWALETKKAVYETDGTNLHWYDLNNRLIELKQNHPFLKDAYSQSLQQAIKRVLLAFQHYFRRLTQGKEKLGYPKFRRRKSHSQSFDVPQFFTIDVVNRRVELPKIGAVKTVFHRRFRGTVRTCTIVATITGKFFISVVVDDGTSSLPKSHVTDQTSVGIDVGLTTYATLSTGEKVENPRHFQNTLKRLKCLHRRMSKKRRGSRNQEKARRRLANCYERVVNQRADFQQKLSTRLIRENQAIIIESLNVRGLIQNRRLAKSVADAAWSRFMEIVRYKAEWYGVTLIVVGQFAPTSKRCHNCGNLNEGLTL